jgi:hypothetical protein
MKNDEDLLSNKNRIMNKTNTLFILKKIKEDFSYFKNNNKCKKNDIIYHCYISSPNKYVILDHKNFFCYELNDNIYKKPSSSNIMKKYLNKIISNQILHIDENNNDSNDILGYIK